MVDNFYIEVGELLARNLHTGIQRVVRQIAKKVAESGAENALSVIPVVTVGDRVFRLNDRGLSALYDPPAVTYSLPSPSEQGLRKAIRPVILKIPPLYNALQRAFVRSKLDGLYTPEPISFGPADYFIILGSFWGGSSVADAARSVARARSSIVAVIYDLIPYTHPEFCDVQNVRGFRAVFTRLLPSLTGIVAISRYSVSEIERYLSSRGIAIPATHFYLGADVGTGGKGRSDVDQPWPKGLHEGAGRIYTTVGTIEPRKGHAAVLDGFERLWAAGAPDKLLIIGKVGWAVDEFMARCASHDELGKRLFLVHTATDTMLNDAYGFSQAAIIASSVEGFGLPLVEALYRHLPVIASDIPVFREIADDKVLYFKLGDPDDLARKVEQMNRNADHYRGLASDFEWIDWHGSAQHFINSVKDVSAVHRAATIANAQ